MYRQKSYIERDFEEMFRGSDKQHLILMMRYKLAKLTAENSNASRKKMVHLKGQILPAIAVFKALCSVMSEDEAFDVMRGYIFNNAKRARKIYDKLMKIPGAYRLMPFAAAKVMKKSFGKDAGFERKTIMVSGGIWRVDITKCPYHDGLKSYGCDRLCRLFCETDDICNSELHPKLVWHRTKTLGKGDDCCDFCLRILPGSQKENEQSKALI